MARPLTRRFSGRQVWPAASPAAAELQFRYAPGEPASSTELFPHRIAGGFWLRGSCSPERQGEQLRDSRRKTRITTADGSVFASQRRPRIGQAVASNAVRVSGRLSAAPVGGPASKSVTVSPNRSVVVCGVSARRGKSLRSTPIEQSVTSAPGCGSLWGPGARGRRNERRGAALSTVAGLGASAFIGGARTVGLQPLARLRSADAVGSTIGRLTRRSSGRQVWPAASPAAAELHIR